MSAATFNTFLKAFGKRRQVLRKRNCGNHAVCSKCATFKKPLSQARFPKDRRSILEEYTGHIVNQWLD